MGAASELGEAGDGLTDVAEGALLGLRLGAADGGSVAADRARPGRRLLSLVLAHRRVQIVRRSAHFLRVPKIIAFIPLLTITPLYKSLHDSQVQSES